MIIWSLCFRFSLYLLTNFPMKSIAEIQKTPVQERTIQEEYLLAKQEKRQPLCVHCGKPLIIEKKNDGYFQWNWDNQTHRYVASLIPGEILGNVIDIAEEPYCIHCGTQDWDFIDEDLVRF